MTDLYGPHSGRFSGRSGGGGLMTTNIFREAMPARLVTPFFHQGVDSLPVRARDLLTTVSDTDDSLGQALAAWESPFQQLRDHLHDMLYQPHTLIGDFRRLTSADWSNAEKQAAAERLVTDWMRVTHFGRYPGARHALYAYARQCGHDPTECLQRHLLPAALRETIERTRPDWNTPRSFKLTWDEQLYGRHFTPWAGCQWLTRQERRALVAPNQLPIWFLIGWLFQQARSDVIDALTGENNASRRLKRRLHSLPRDHQDDWPALLAEREPHAMESALRLTGQVRIQFPALTPLEAQIYILNRVGRNATEIGDWLGRRPDAIRQTLRRAKKKVGRAKDHTFDIQVCESPRGGQHEVGQSNAVPNHLGRRAC